MKFEPYDYQKYCISRIIDTNKVGLYIDMGLGKTIITLTAIKKLKYEMLAIRKVLVIAPKKVAESTWTKEAEKWDGTKILRFSKVLGSREKRIKALTKAADIYITNRENVTWLCDYYRNDWPFDMVIVDESSSFKSPKAKRFKALAGMLPKIERLVELTGTPSPHGIEDLWSQVYLLDQGERLGKRFSGFRNRYFDPGARSANIIYSYTPKPRSYESVLNKIQDICISMKAEDYLQLPDMILQDIPVELDQKAMKAYTDLEKQMVLDLPEDEEEISVTTAAALSNKLLQLSNGAVYDEDHIPHEVHKCKIEAFMELIESLQGKPALVFYNFKHDKFRILEALEKTDLNVRELRAPQDQDDWNSGKVDILLAHPASAAYGLNLQEGGNHVVWFGLTWNYEQYTQANARLHRQGQNERVIVHHLVCQGTRDEDVMGALRLREDAQDYVMESLKARIRKIRKENKK